MQRLVPDYMAPLVQWPPIPIIPLALGLTYTSMLFIKGVSSDFLHGAVSNLDQPTGASGNENGSGSDKRNSLITNRQNGMENRLKIWKSTAAGEEAELRISSFLAMAFTILPLLLPLLPPQWFSTPPMQLAPIPNALACTSVALLIEVLRQTTYGVEPVTKYLGNIATNRPLTAAENRDLRYWIPEYHRQHALRTLKLGFATLAGFVACWLLYRESR